jgi:hypothetical protein
MSNLTWRRINELAGMFAVGDGLIATLAPERHIQLWRGGPRFWDRTVEAFETRPTLTRAVGIVEMGFGIWLMLRQVEKRSRWSSAA